MYIRNSMQEGGRRQKREGRREGGGKRMEEGGWRSAEGRGRRRRGTKGEKTTHRHCIVNLISHKLISKVCDSI